MGSKLKSPVDFIVISNTNALKGFVHQLLLLHNTVKIMNFCENLYLQSKFRSLKINTGS